MNFKPVATAGSFTPKDGGKSSILGLLRDEFLLVRMSGGWIDIPSRRVGLTTRFRSSIPSRMAAATEFNFSRCQTTKTAKLVAVVSGDWNRVLCNGYYGKLVSEK